MAETFTMYKPCGRKMKVSEGSIDYVISLGWTDKPKTQTKANTHGRNSKNINK
jgi:hypothetical protein